MSKPSLLFTVSRLLESPHGLTVEKLSRDLDVSRATAYRLVEQIRATFGVALVKDKRTHRYRIDGDKGLEWPGIFMQSNELPLILAMLDWLQNTGEASFDKMSSKLRTKIEAWIQNTDGDLSRWNEIIRILPSHGRRHLPNILPQLCRALFLRRKIAVVARQGEDSNAHQNMPGISGQNLSPRLLSPQTLVYYRDTWYLDAFCHVKQDLRTFSLHRFEAVTLLEESAKRISRTTLKDYFADSYGIFAGKADKQAEIVFSKRVAEFVAHENWHPNQVTTCLPNGDWQLCFPFGDSRELVRDICRWSDGLVSIEPPSLKAAVVEALKKGLNTLAKEAKGLQTASALAPGGRRGPRSGRPRASKANRE